MEGDLSEKEIIKLMENYIKLGWKCFIKWTCEKCGERVTSNKANAFFTKGWKHDDCGHISFPKKYGLMITRGIRVS